MFNEMIILCLSPNFGYFRNKDDHVSQGGTGEGASSPTGRLFNGCDSGDQ